MEVCKHHLTIKSWVVPKMVPLLLGEKKRQKQ